MNDGKNTSKRVVKCQVCNNKKKGMDMFQHKIKQGEKEVNKYTCFGECAETYRKDIKRKRMEAKKMTELFDFIADIHGMQTLNNRFFSHIQDLRNGTLRYVKNASVQKKYKQGIPYEVIKEAYRICQRDIRWAKENKNFDDDLGELKYGFAIVQNNIGKATKRLREVKKRKENHHNSQSVGHPEVEKEIEYKKKKNDNDISNFLD